MLKIGWGTRNIVPDRPAMVQGQMHTRVAKQAMDPLTVTAMAVQGNRRGGAPDCAVLGSLDVAFVSEEVHEGVRRRIAKQAPELPGDKIVLAATHSHTSLVYGEGFYPQPPGDVMTPGECESFLIDRTAEAVLDAWRSLAPCRMARAFGHAVVAHNRRPVFADGSAQMYASPNRPAFRYIESTEDHSLDMFFVWDAAGKLTGIVLDVPCPSQVDEQLEVWSADYWHETRVELRKRLGDKLWVLPLCGAAGDQSPHFIFDAKPEAEMRRRRGVSERQEIALRLGDAVQRALACTTPADGAFPVAHTVQRVSLTPRQITRQERDWHEAQHAQTIGKMDPALWWPTRLQGVVDIFDGKRPNPPVPVELHTLRLGDAALVTNPFELYVDYGLRIKGRSAAAQTFISQITGGIGWYLPTERGVQGGGYGSIPVVSIVGPEGGQELVEHAVASIAELFPENAPAPAR